jgi:plastocyanin
MVRIKHLTLGYLFILAFALPALATRHNVDVHNFAFVPATVTVAPGDSIVWTNSGGFHNVHHNATPSLFGNTAGSGWTYTYVVSLSAGTYDYICEIHPASMVGHVIVQAPNAVGERTHAQIGGFALDQNYPNPFNSTTNIQFSVPFESDVHLTLMNVLGQQIGQIFQGHVTAGQHSVPFDASGLTTGIYFYRLETPSGVLVRKMSYLK